MTTFAERSNILIRLLEKPEQPLSEEFIKANNFKITLETQRLKAMFEKHAKGLRIERPKIQNGFTDMFFTVTLKKWSRKTEATLLSAGFKSIRDDDSVFTATHIDLNCLVALLDAVRRDGLEVITFDPTVTVDLIQNAIRHPTGVPILELAKDCPAFLVNRYLREYGWDPSLCDKIMEGKYTIDSYIYNGTYVVKVVEVRTGRDCGRWQGNGPISVSGIAGTSQCDAQFNHLVFNMIIAGSIKSWDDFKYPIRASTIEPENDFVEAVVKLLEDKTLSKSELAKQLMTLAEKNI